MLVNKNVHGIHIFEKFIGVKGVRYKMDIEIDYMSFEYGQRDGRIITKNEFYGNCVRVSLTPEQIRRLEGNLERQCLLILQKSFGRECLPEDFRGIPVWKNEETKEFYLKPLYEDEVRVYIKKRDTFILIYDIRRS